MYLYREYFLAKVYTILGTWTLRAYPKLIPKYRNPQTANPCSPNAQNDGDMPSQPRSVWGVAFSIAAEILAAGLGVIVKEKPGFRIKGFFLRRLL